MRTSPQRRIGARAGVALVAAALMATAMVACSSSGPSPAQKLAKSQQRPPVIYGGRVDKTAAGEAVHVAVTYPNVAARSELSTVTANVYTDADGVQLVGSANRRGSVHGTVQYDLPVTGAAASALAASTDPLSLVSVQVDSKRDLHGSPAPDHEWIVTSAGPQLAQTEAQAVAPSSTGLEGARATLNITNHANAPVLVDLAPATCMYDETVWKHNVWLENGDGKALSVEIQADNNTGHSIADHQGIGQLEGLASEVYSPDVRQFGYEMAAANAGADIVPRFENVILNMPQHGTCYDRGHTFVVGVEEHGAYGTSYGHAAQVLSEDNDGQIHFFGWLTGRNLNPTLKEGSSATFDVRQGAPLPVNCKDNVEGWMGCAYPTDSSQGDTPLSSIVWPGTHDSATAQLGVGTAWMNTDTSRNTACSSYDPAYKAVPVSVYHWAVTQPDTLREQLDRGVRYFDLRTSWLAGQPQWPRFGHTMAAQATIDLDLQTVAMWAYDHPKEVVIVNFSDICNGNGGDLNSFAKALTSPDPTTTPPVSLCSQSYRGDRPYASNVGEQTINGIRNAPLAAGATGHNIIVLLDDNIFGAADSLPKQCGFVPRWNGDGHSSAGEAGFSGSYVPMPAPGAGLVGECTLKDFPTPGHDVDQGDNAYFQSYFTSGATSPDLMTFRNVYPTGLYSAPINYEFSSDKCAISLVVRDAFWLNKYSGLINWDQGLEANTQYTVHPTRTEIVQAWGRNANIVLTDALTDDFVPTIVGIDQSAPPPRPDTKGTSLYACAPAGQARAVNQYTIGTVGQLSPKQDPGPTVGARCTSPVATSDGSYMYGVAASPANSGALVGWTAGRSGQLAPMDPAPPAAVSGVQRLAITPDDKVLIAASSDQIQTFLIGAGGVLASAQTPIPVSAGAQIQSMIVDPDGKSVELAET